MTLSTKISAPKGYSVHHVVCPHDCPDTCSMLVTRDDTTGRPSDFKAIRVIRSPRGYLCNKVNHYLTTFTNEKRVLIRISGSARKALEPSSNALLGMRRWRRCAITSNRSSDNTGPEAVQPYSYSGTFGLARFLGHWTSAFWEPR